MAVFDETHWHDCPTPFLFPWCRINGRWEFLDHAERRKIFTNGKWRWEYRSREETEDEMERRLW